MTGKNHVVTNTCSVICIGSGVFWLNRFAENLKFMMLTGNNNLTTNVPFLQSVIIGCNNTIQQFLAFTLLNMGDTNRVLFGIVAAAAFYIGTLFPDIDNENSMLGEFFHLPIEHRTWTHAIWLPILFSLLALIRPIMWWFVLGYIGHLLWDNASRGGVCFFYPISNYRYFGNSGAKVKDGHFVHLYRTGKPSEGVVVGIVVSFTILLLTVDVCCLFLN